MTAVFLKIQMMMDSELIANVSWPVSCHSGATSDTNLAADFTSFSHTIGRPVKIGRILTLH
jgi:hypothetical protein